MQGASRVQKNDAGVFEVEVPPPLSLEDLPPALSHTLQHIVGKLDMMTQVLGMVEERLSMNEDKMATLQTHVTSLVEEQLRAHDDKVAHAISRLKADLSGPPPKVFVESSTDEV
jgi:hypothetical protein